MRLTKTVYDKNPKLCKYCGKQIPYVKRENRYCNSSCFASDTNKGVCRNKKYYDAIRGGPKQVHVKKATNPAKPIQCKFCGKPIKPTRNWVLFCNDKKCPTLYKTAELIKNGLITWRNRMRVKSYLIHTRGHKCESCNLTHWKNEKIPIELHHKDGDVNNMILENLGLLCPNCHTFTDTYKSKNHIKKDKKGEYSRG